MSRLKKKISIAVFSITGTIFVIIFGGLLFLETSAFQTISIKTINKNIPGHLSMEELDIDIFSGNFYAHGIQIKDQNKKVVSNIKNLAFDLSLQKLLKKELYLSLIEIDSPEFDLSMTGQGKLNLVSAFVFPDKDSKKKSKKKKEPFVFPFNIKIKKVAFSNGNIDFKIPDKDLDVSTSGLNLVITDFNLLKQSARIESKIQHGLIHHKEKFIDISPFKASTNVSAKHISNFSVQTSVNNFHAQLKANGALDNPDADLKITYGPGTVHNYSIDQLLIECSLKDRVLTILPSSLDSDLGQLSVDGKINLKKAFSKGFFDNKKDLDLIGYQFNIHQDQTGLSLVPGSAERLKGKVASIITFHGKGIDPEKIKAELIADINGSKILSRQMQKPLDVHFHASAALDGSMAELKNLKIDIAENMVLTGNADFNIPDFKIPATNLSGLARLEIKDAALLENLTGIPARGQIQLSASMEGALLHPEIKVDGKAYDLEVKDIHLGNLLLNADLDKKGRLQINNALVKLKESAFKIHGMVDLFEPGFDPDSHSAPVILKQPYLDMRFAGKPLLLEDFVKEVNGKIFLDGRIKGSPEQFNGRLTLKGDTFNIKGHTIDNVSADAVIKNQTIDIKKIDIQVAPGSNLVAKGRVLPMEQTFDISLISQNFDLTCLDLLEKEILKTGLLSLDVKAQGSFKKPRLDGQINIKNLIVLNEKRDPVDLVFKLENKDLNVKGNIGPDVKANYNLDTKNFSAFVSMDSLTLDPYFQQAGQSDFTGSISAEINAQGNADKIEKMSAQASISNLTISRNEKPFIRLNDTETFLKNRVLTLDDTRIDLVQGGSLNIKGEGSLDKDLDFTASGMIPLEIVTPYVKQIKDAKGKINIAASIKGSIKDPLIRADLTFDDLGMAAQHLEPEFENLSGKIQITPHKIDIVKFTGRLNQGRFDLEGSCALAHGSPEKFNLDLNVHNLPVDIPDTMDLTLNTDINFAGTMEKSHLTGEIVLLDGLYYKDVEMNLLEAATRQKRQAAPVKDRQANPLLETIALNIHVKQRHSLVVDNNLANLDITPDLIIRGTAKNPVLTGRAQVDSGSVFFQKAKFNVDKGVIDFTNPYKIEPSIDLTATTDIRTWTILLDVSGTPEDLNLELSSNPREEHADILSLIVTGKTSRELQQGSGNKALNPEKIASDLVTGKIEKNLKDATGLDKLEISQESQGDSGSRDIHVSVGTNLSRQMSISFDMDVQDGETIQRITTDYKVMENLLMSGFQESDGNFGGKLKYRMEFR